MNYDIMGDWVLEYHGYQVKIDYFNRIRVFVTQLIPDMVSDEGVPADFQLKFVIKTYKHFQEIGRKNNPARDTLALYAGQYATNLNELIEKKIMEDESDELDRRLNEDL